MTTSGNRMKIGVIGAGSCSPEISDLACRVGREIARQGAVLLCGGLGGVMAAAARGAKEAGGFTVGILPGPSDKDANPFIDLSIVTDMGHARNIILVRSSDALVAVSGGYGTLSELAVALKVGIPCVGINTWDMDPGIIGKDSPEAAVLYAVEKIRERGAV